MFASSASATGDYWYDIGSDWYTFLDNGKMYIKSETNMAVHCDYERAFLTTSYGDAAYQDRLAAYVLAGMMSGKSIKIVLNDTQTTCEFKGAKLY